MECAAYGLEQPAQCLTAVPVFGEERSDESSERHRFLVGTASWRGGNKVSVLEYRDENRLVECVADWVVSGEVRALDCAKDAPLSAVLHAPTAMTSTSVCSVARIAPAAVAESPLTVTCAPITSGDDANHLWSVKWSPRSADTLAVLTSTGVSMVKLGAANAAASARVADFPSIAFGANSAASAASRSSPALAWDPHQADVLYAAVNGARLQRIDGRKKTSTALLQDHPLAAAGAVTVIEPSPNKMHAVATAGTDGFVRFWDLRKPDAPVGRDGSGASRGSFRAHDHACRALQFNHFRDELILTASSDHTAKVWFDPVVGGKATPPSTSLGQSPTSADPPSTATELKKGLVASFPPCGDAVYAAAWSAASPWVYAAIAYNGKVLIDEVPRTYKVGLLLLAE